MVLHGEGRGGAGKAGPWQVEVSQVGISYWGWGTPNSIELGGVIIHL